MSNTLSLYFTKFSNWDKQILTEFGWDQANNPDILKINPISAYQIKDFVSDEYQKIMSIPYAQAIDSYFPNI